MLNLLSIALTHLLLSSFVLSAAVCIACYSKMFSCNYCPLQFNTEEKLDVHTKKCETLSKPSSSNSHICGYCKTSFMTAKKLVAHGDTCEVKFRSIVTSQLESINNSLNELKQAQTKEQTKKLEPVECRFCLLTFGTAEEVNAHRKTCKVLATISMVGELCTNLSATWGYEKLSVMSPLCPTSPAISPTRAIINSINSIYGNIELVSPVHALTPKTSRQKFLGKRVLHTPTEKDRTTKSESSSVQSSSPKMCRSEVIRDVETKQSGKKGVQGNQGNNQGKKGRK